MNNVNSQTTGNIDLKNVQSTYGQASNATLTISQDIPNALVTILYDCNKWNCIPTSDAIFDSYVTIPQADIVTPMDSPVGALAEKSYYFSKLEAGTVITARVYNSTYGYNYIIVKSL